MGHARDRRPRTDWYPPATGPSTACGSRRATRWGADITSETDPFAAAWGCAVRMDKEFLGRDRVSGVRSDRRLVCLVLDDPRSVALGNEPVKDGGVVVGRASSGGLGYSLGLSIAYAGAGRTGRAGHAADRGGLRRDGRRRGAGRSALRSGRRPHPFPGLTAPPAPPPTTPATRRNSPQRRHMP